MRKKRDAASTHPLVGKWFHSYDPEQPEVIFWQGKVLAEVTPGQFLVQLFEWFVGAPSKQVLVPVADMATWAFYPSNAQMNAAYDRYAERRNQIFNAMHGDGVTPPQNDGPVH